MARPPIRSACGCSTPCSQKGNQSMTTQAQFTLLDSPERNRPGDGEERTEVLHWDGRLDNRDDLLLRLKESLRGATSNAALALAAYERWGTDGLVRLIG